MSYVPPLADIRFVMEELADLSDVLALEEGDRVSPDLVHAVLDEAGRFAANVLAPLNAVGDREGSRLVDGRVVTPTGFKAAYAQYVEAAWGGIGAPLAYGGQQMPHLVTAAVGELWKASNLAFSANFLLTTGAVEALVRHGSPEQQRRYLPHMVAGTWCGVMNLTEPQAGSDLAAIRTRAEPRPDGTYRLFGQKCFITYADHDMAENIVHLVLARTPDAPPGTKGISMFLVSQRAVADDGSLGARNDVQVTALEEKMGQHASPTCVVVHGEHDGAVAELVGEIGAGLAGIFTMVNAARLGVALEGLGIGERAYQQAHAYAHTRVQGRVPGHPESVVIARHPDVRRMLLTMKAQVEAMRALAYVAASWLDRAKGHPDPVERRRFKDLVDLMIPVLKGWMTETGAKVASLGIQVHGGAGFIEETGAAQYLRDVRVTAIYEGTTGIQAGDLVGRKLGRAPGPQPLRDLLASIASLVGVLAQAGEDDLRAIGDALTSAHGAATRATEAMLATDAQDALFVSVAFLELLGTTLGGWQLARGALAAARRRTDDPAFMAAKIETARHYAEHVLPAVLGLADTVVRGCARSRPAFQDAA